MPKARAYRWEEATNSYKQCKVEEATHIYFEPPCGVGRRMLPVVHKNATRKGTNCWSWNGDLEKPTLKPSILNRFVSPDESISPSWVCHSWVNDGQVIYLDDCTHEGRGKTLDLLELTDD